MSALIDIPYGQSGRGLFSCMRKVTTMAKRAAALRTQQIISHHQIRKICLRLHQEEMELVKVTRRALPRFRFIPFIIEFATALFGRGGLVDLQQKYIVDFSGVVMLRLVAKPSI
jgi:hypothetical protein